MPHICDFLHISKNGSNPFKNITITFEQAGHCKKNETSARNGNLPDQLANAGCRLSLAEEPRMGFKAVQ
jgi:hypothetical protein